METIENMRADFWEAWEGLAEVHTQEDLEAQTLKMNAARERLLEADPQFRAMIEANQRRRKMRGNRMKAEHRAQMLEAKARARANKSKRPRSGFTDKDLDAFVQSTKYKTRTPEEAKKQSEEELWCPICRVKDAKHNVLNGVPTCFDPSHRPHRLVHKSEVGNYNRKYRKKWLSRRRKK